MSTAQHNLKVILALTHEHGDEYKATVTATLTHGHLLPRRRAQRSACPLTPKARGSVEYLHSNFTHEGASAQIVRNVSKSIMVKIPSVKRSVAAYAVVNGQVAGEASAALPKKVAHAAK